MVNQKTQTEERRKDDRIERPRVLPNRNGRPGNYILESNRAGGGVVLGEQTYKAIISNLTTLPPSEEFSLDETLAYMDIMREYYHAMGKVGNLFVEQVRNPNGVIHQGINFKMSLEQLAEGIFTDKNPSFIMSVLSLAGLVPGMLSWADKIKYARDEASITPITDMPDELRDAAVAAIRTKLVVLKSEGYVGARLGLTYFDESINEYHGAAESVKSLLTDAAKAHITGQKQR